MSSDSPKDDTTVIEPVGDPAGAGTATTGVDDGPVPDDAIIGPVPVDGHEPRETSTTAETLRRTAKFWAPPLALVLAAAAVLGFWMYDRAGTAMPGVALEGVDVSGMDAASIEAEMASIVAERRSASITAAAAGQEFVFQLGASGYEADLDLAVDQALSAGRDGPIDTITNHVAATFGRTWSFDLDGATITDPIDDFVADVADDVYVEPFDGTVQLDRERATVTGELPSDGLELDQDAARGLLVGLAGTGQDASVELPTIVLEPITVAADVTQAVTSVEATLAAAFVLAHQDSAITIEPTEMADYLVVGGPAEQFALQLDQPALREAMEGRGSQFDVEPVSARYSIDGGWRTYDNQGSGTWDPTPASVSIIEGNNGLTYNPDAATQQVVDLYESGEHTAELALDVVEPRLSNDKAVALRPDALLGTFTTYDACCGNRQHNIRRLADLVDGAMLLPGENYSVNDTIGPRTAAKGFLPAGAIVDGEIDDGNIGGGISQTATTFYNAAFFSGIEILQHRPHSWPISRYPLGREATFDYKSDLDIDILNNTSHAIIVSTSWSGSSVTFSIFGFDDGRQVTADMGSPYDYTDYPTERRANSSMTEGTERVVQSGGQGFSFDFRRIITGGETPGSQNLSWTYSPKTLIIEYGTKPAPPPPPPEPEPTATPDPGPTPPDEPTPPDPN